MPAPPYAKLQAIVNAGAPQSGAITLPTSASVQFVAESTVGWRKQRWELYEYPLTWPTPAGWTLDAQSGIIYSLAITPQAITFPGPAGIWGKWLPRLLVNEGVDGSLNQDLKDERTGLTLASPKGQEDIGAGEAAQFGGAWKRWVAAYQKNIRAIETLLAAAAILPINLATQVTGILAAANLPDASPSAKGIVQLAGSIAGSATNVFVTAINGAAGIIPIFAPEQTWGSVTPFVRCKRGLLQTSDASFHAALNIPVPTGTSRYIEALIKGEVDSASGSGTFVKTLRAMYYNVSGTAVQAFALPSETGSVGDGTLFDARLTINGAGVDIEVKGKNLSLDNFLVAAQVLE